MNNKSRHGLLMIAGGYLAYLGFQLISGYLAGREGSGLVGLIFGGLFIVLGIWVAVYHIRELLRSRSEAEEANEEVEALDQEVENLEAIKGSEETTMLDGVAENTKIEKETHNESGTGL